MLHKQTVADQVSAAALKLLLHMEIATTETSPTLHEWHLVDQGPAAARAAPGKSAPVANMQIAPRQRLEMQMNSAVV